MIRANFKVVATILALHVPEPIAVQFKALNELSTNHDDQYNGIEDLVESNILALMHDVYVNITGEGTPLHIPPIFASCMEKFLKHEKLGHLSEFILSVHENPVTVKSDLSKHGITVTYDDDGVTVETGNRKIMPETDTMH